MAASGAGSLVFIDDVNADKSSRMNSEVFRAILSAHIQPNASELIGRRFTVQMDSDPKHAAKATKEFFKAKTIQKYLNYILYCVYYASIKHKMLQNNIISLCSAVSFVILVKIMTSSHLYCAQFHHWTNTQLSAQLDRHAAKQADAKTWKIM